MDLSFPLPQLKGIHSEDIHLDEAFEDFAGRFAHIPGTVVLLSGGDLDCARYHILGAYPWLKLTGRHHDIQITVGSDTVNQKANPFDLLQQLIRTYHLDDTLITRQPEIPIYCGLMGYLSYDLKDCLEILPRTSVDRTHLPSILLYAPSILLVHDKAKNKTRLHIPKLEGIKGYSVSHQRKRFDIQSKKPAPPLNKDRPNKNPISTGRLKSNFKKEHYIEKIKAIIEYIASGHVYQVNMSQQFAADFKGDSYELFKTYYRLNPAPFFAYIHAGDHQIVSTSPERFLLQDKKQVETRPIKGTRPRGKSPEQDEELRDKLFNSKKDDAELSMIVDLLRNDIGKVCAGGSVYVAEHKRVEAYQNVYHLVSIVKGTLDEPYNSIDLIRAAFPGGSITGCPKIRAMEIIDELEPDRRHLYTGSIGYISFHDTMDLSIVIRTATVYNGKLIFSVGGGIVYDSDPEKEFEETLHKGQTLMSALVTNSRNQENQDMLWLNGTLVPADTAGIPVGDLGFQYGYGFFETIRADRGNPKNLTAHLKRFENSWTRLFKDPVPDLTWDIIIKQVLQANGLDDKIAAVKLMATKGSRDRAPYDHGLIVTARPYVHRLAGKAELGLDLATYPFPRQTPLANHKTLNYLYYYRAGQWAKKRGQDEALILNPDGSISETNTASLICIKNNQAILPLSQAVLPGTMQKTVADVLKQWGYEIQHKQILPAQLFSFEDVLLTNALMGAVPVLSVDKTPLTKPSALWTAINQTVL